STRQARSRQMQNTSWACASVSCATRQADDNARRNRAPIRVSTIKILAARVAWSHGGIQSLPCYGHEINARRANPCAGVGRLHEFDAASCTAHRAQLRRSL